jgi:LPXTG-site transpeptidase (sortase) family protein
VTADSNESAPDADTLNIPITQGPAYTIIKTITSTGPYDSAGDVITYQVLLTNTGNVTLTGVNVSDPLLSDLDCDGTPGTPYVTSSLTISVGSGLTCSGSYTLTQNDLDTNGGGDGDVDNTATGDTDQTGPQSSSAAAPLTLPPGFFDPPFGQKVLNAALLPELEWKMVWINNSNSAAINVQITDPIPVGTTYVLNSLSCVANNASSTTSCLYDSIQNRIFWQGVIAPDPGVTDELSANNEVVITFRVTVPDTLNQVNNQGSSLTDTNGDGSFADETDPAVSVSVSNIAAWSRGAGGGGGGGAGGPFSILPRTGFAPGESTELPVQPSNRAYSDTDIWLEIPSLGLHTTIVGVPNADGTWDVSWLWRQIGWLQGTAFPTWSGNSVFTGHVYLSDGEPGPFVDLHKLSWGDRIIIHAYGSKYIYEVRGNLVVQPGDLSVLRHEEEPWITLLTCQGYNEATDSYAHRVAVRAVLIKVTDDLSTPVRDKR